MRLTMVVAAALLLAACEEPKKPQVAPLYQLDAADRRKAIDRGTFVGERLACGCPLMENCSATDCPSVFDSFALRHHCRVGKADSYSMVFLNKDPAERRLAVAKESCECFVATHAIVVKGLARERAELAAEVRCGLARHMMSEKDKP